MTQGRFEGSTAIVTAAASGIGWSIAERLAAEQCNVVVGDIDVAGLARLTALYPDKIIGRRCDVRDEHEIEALVDAAIRQFGSLDLAANVAGIGGTSLLVETSAEQWDCVQATTLRSVFFCIKHQAKRMVRQAKGGAIVNIASINATSAAPAVAAYNAAKAGVVNLTMTSALELGECGVRVNAVGPGLVETPMTSGMLASAELVGAFRAATPLRRHGQPQDIAAAVAFLLSDEASWITGQTLYVDGGQTISGYPDLRDFRNANAVPSTGHDVASNVGRVT